MHRLLAALTKASRGRLMSLDAYRAERGVKTYRDLSKPSVRARTPTVEIYRFPKISSPHYATVKDRTRNSGLTSVTFLGRDRFVCCDFNEKRAYFAEVKRGELRIIDSHPTVVSGGDAVQTDLIDSRDNEFVVSNFYQGSASCYRINQNKIEFVGEVNHNRYTNLHGVRYVPNQPSLLWMCFCGKANKCHQLVDRETGCVVHHFNTNQQCQDVAFSGRFAVVFARTNHVAQGELQATRRASKEMFATAYIYALGENLYRERPKLISVWHGEGHIDGVKTSDDGRIYAANQYLDRVDVFDLSSEGQLSLSEIIPVEGMPHGLDIAGGKVAVTCYEESTLMIFPELAASESH